ncbi:DEAD/DEAH box helicase family protein [Altererythrobacter sp. TH136]|uniref:DEAD/DEAH box helicase family protein n=1 Tax=Altererythrobacter sp. TH136 TaxID=2067415 RepID=UPI001AEF9F54|nr:DEAD/DEAH box helicase family protein [Altererythrobacter sp. TH136]
MGWGVDDGTSVRFEYTLSDRTRADYVMCNRHGHPIAVLEAKRTRKSPREGEEQARRYAALLDVPFIYLSNGEEMWGWEPAVEAHPRRISTLPSQLDLERMLALREQRRDPLSVEIDKRIAGRDYQMDCINTVCREITVGRRKMLVEMATGTGKTRTAAALIKRLFEAGQVNRVLFLVDRITLAKQAEDAFAEHLPEFPAYVLRNGRRFQDEKRITISTLQTFIGEYHKLPSSYFQLVVVDECHRSIYGKWSGTLRHFDALMVGLTATPCVATEEVVRNAEDGAFIRDTLRFFELERPTFRYGLKQAIQEGHLLPYKIYKAKTVKTAADGGFEVRRDELDWSAMDAETREEFERLFAGEDKITVDPNALERKFTIPERNRALAREYRSVVENGFVGTDGVRRYPMEGKAIVFAVTKRHAETLASLFDQEFADRKPSSDVRYADYVVSGSGPEDTVDSFAKIDRFKKEKFPQILVSVNMLDTGFDAPEVVHLVMARFTKSAILYQQMRGRGTRRADHIRKVNFTIFDFVGVTDYHADDENLPEGGVVVIKPRPDEATARRLLVLDVHDHIDPTTRDWVTLDADGNLIPNDASTAHKAELALRFESWLLDKNFNSDQLRLLRLVESQIDANPDMTSFGIYRFTQPPFSFNGGVQRARQVFGGDEGLRAMLVSLNSSVFPTGGGDASDVRPSAQPN